MKNTIWLTFIFYVLNLVILSASVANVKNENVASRIHNMCPSWSYIPKDLLNKRLSKGCGLNTKREIFIYGENHSSDVDKVVNWYANGMVNKGHLTKFIEGMSGSDPDRGFYGLNSIGHARGYTELLIYLVQHDNPLFSKIIFRSLSDSMCHFKDLWINNVELKNSDVYLLKSIYSILQNKNPSMSCSESLLGSINKYMEDEHILHEVILSYKKNIREHLLKTYFIGVSEEHLDTKVIQELREVEWGEVIQRSLCLETERTRNNPVWIQVGEFHRENLSCLLNQIYSDEVSTKQLKIHSIVAEDISFIKRRSAFQRDFVSTLNLKAQDFGLLGDPIKISSADTYKGFSLNLRDVPKGSRSNVFNMINNLDYKELLLLLNDDSSALMYISWAFKDIDFLIGRGNYSQAID